MQDCWQPGTNGGKYREYFLTGAYDSTIKKDVQCLHQTSALRRDLGINRQDRGDFEEYRHDYAEVCLGRALAGCGSEQGHFAENKIGGQWGHFEETETWMVWLCVKIWGQFDRADVGDGILGKKVARPAQEELEDGYVGRQAETGVNKEDDLGQNLMETCH